MALVENAADPAQVARAEQREKQRAKQARHQLLTVLKTEVGRKVLFRVLEQCGIFHTPFRGDPYNTAYQCGRQNVGQWLLAQIEDADTTMPFRMMQEHAADARAEEEAALAARTPSVTEDA